MKWYMNDILPYLYTKAYEERGYSDLSFIPLKRLLLNFIKHRNKYNENHEFDLDDWKYCLKYMAGEYFA